jgi:hypothetical protein
MAARNASTVSASTSAGWSALFRYLRWIPYSSTELSAAGTRLPVLDALSGRLGSGAI